MTSVLVTTSLSGSIGTFYMCKFCAKVAGQVQALSDWPGNVTWDVFRFGSCDQYRMVRTEQSSEHSCSKSVYSSEPALEMSDITQRKCKNVVREIEKKLACEGRKIAPILADIWNRDEKSFYVAAFSGIRILNFKIISQHLDETVYETVNDFVKEVQSMLKGVADQFGFSSEVISEVTNIHDLFFEIINCTFKDVDFRKARSEVEFSSGRPTIAFLSMGGSPSQRKRRGKGGRPVGRINPAKKPRAGTSK